MELRTASNGDGTLPRSNAKGIWSSPVVRKTGIALLLAVLAFAALSAYADLQSVLDGFATYHYHALWMPLVLSLASFVLRGYRFHIYLRMLDVKLPMMDTMLVFLGGLVMTVTPGKAGEVFKAVLLKWTHDTPISVGSPVVVAERLMDLFGLLLIAAWGALILPAGVAISLTCALTVAGALAVLGSERFWTWGLASLSKVRFLEPKLERVAVAQSAMLTLLRPRAVMFGVGVSLVAWFLQVIALLLVVRGIPGADLSIQTASLAYAAPLIAGVATLLPGGIGVTEFGMTGLLEASDGAWSTAANATLATILTRLVTLWFAVLVGAVALGIHRRRTGWAQGR